MIPLRWVVNWTPGSQNELQFFVPAPVPWVKDENYVDAWRTDYEWNDEAQSWGTWRGVPEVTI